MAGVSLFKCLKRACTEEGFGVFQEERSDRVRICQQKPRRKLWEIKILRFSGSRRRRAAAGTARTGTKDGRFAPVSIPRRARRSAFVRIWAEGDKKFAERLSLWRLRWWNMDEKNIKKGQGKQLKKLSKRHLECIELMVAGEFQTDREIAQFLEVAPETLSRWKNSDVFREELERRIDEEERYRRMRYRAKANHAADILFSMMDSVNGKLAMEAVLKVLELAGDGRKEEATGSGPIGVVVLPEISPIPPEAMRK